MIIQADIFVHINYPPFVHRGECLYIYIVLPFFFFFNLRIHLGVQLMSACLKLAYSLPPDPIMWMCGNLLVFCW